MYLIETSLVSLPMNPEAEVTRWYIEKGQPAPFFIFKAIEDFEKSGGKILKEDNLLDESGGRPVLANSKKEEVIKEMKIIRISQEDIIKDIDGEIASLKSLIEKTEDDEIKASLNTLLEKAKKKKEEYPLPEEKDKKKKDISELSKEQLEVELARKKKEKYPYPETKEKDIEEELTVEEMELELARRKKKEEEEEDDEAKKARKKKEEEEEDDEAKKARKKKEEEYPYPKKKSGESYSQIEVDQIIASVKEKVEDYFNDQLTKKDQERVIIKDDLSKRIDQLHADLESNKADAQVEKKWSGLVGSAYKEEDAEEIKPLLKKAMIGEALTTEETDLLIDKKIGESNLLVGTEDISKSMSAERRADLIKKGGIKISNKE